MSTVSIGNLSFKVGDVLTDSSGKWGYKLISHQFIDEIRDYRYLCAEVNIRDNKAQMDDKPYMVVRSGEELRNSFVYLWTQDPETKFKKGQIYKDESGSYYVVEKDNGVAWSLSRGTYAQIKSDFKGGLTWSSRNVKLTLVKNVSGECYSKFLK